MSFYDNENKKIEAALTYLAMGWHPIPIRTDLGEKKPYIRWKQYQESAPSEGMIRSWWSKWPKAGIGLITGPATDLAVIDIDERAGANMNLRRWPPTYTVGTPGGLHLYYRYPAGGLKNSASKFEKGIDIRGEDGYVIAPPTVRADGGVYKILSEAEIVEFPHRPIEEPELLNFDEIVLQSTPGWVDELLEEGVTQGARNDSVTRIAGYFAREGRPLSDSLQTLLEWNELKVSPPLDRADIEDVVRRIYHSERIRKGKERLSKKNGQKTLNLVQLPAFYEKYKDYQEHWLIEGWLPVGSIGIVVSPPECYKTWLAGELAVAIATGRNLFGEYEVTGEGHDGTAAIVVQQEDAFGQTAVRYNIQSNNGLEEQDPNMDRIWIQDGRDFHFSKEASRRELYQAVKKHRPKLVIFDPLYSVVTPDDHLKNAHIEMKILKKLRDEFDTTFLLVHHASKSDEVNFNRERLLGSQYLNAFVEFGFQVAKLDDAKTAVKRHFKMSAPPQPLTTSWVIDSTGEEIVYAPVVEEYSSDKFAELIADTNAKPAARFQKPTPVEFEYAAPGELDFMGQVLVSLFEPGEGFRLQDLARAYALAEPEANFGSEKDLVAYVKDYIYSATGRALFAYKKGKYFRAEAFLHG